MGKKNQFVRLRVDEDLKAALERVCREDDRQESDEARHLLKLGLEYRLQLIEKGQIVVPKARGSPRSKAG